LASVSAASNREDLIARAVDLLSQRFRRAVAFVLKNREARVVSASPGLDMAGLGELEVSLDLPSVLSSVQSVPNVHVMKPPDSEGTRAFLERMGGGGQSCLLV